MPTKKIYGVDTLDWRQIPIDWDAVTVDIIKAGTPMDMNGHICNDGNVYGILMDDVLRKSNKQGRVIISGCVDLKAAAESSGIQLSDAAKAALPDVWVNTGDWDRMENKPFCEYEATTDTLTWDGNAEGRDALTVIQGDETHVFAYKVSDVVPTPEDLSRGIVFAFNDGETLNVKDDIISEYVETYKEFGFLFPPGDSALYIFPHDNFTFNPEEGVSFVAPSAGVYFADYRPNENFYLAKLTIKGYNGFTGTFVKTIEPKFLPEGYPYEEFELVGAFTENNSMATMTLYADATYVVEVDGVRYETKLQTQYHSQAGQHAFLGSAVWTLNSGAIPPFSIYKGISSATTLEPVDGVPVEYTFWHMGADAVDVKVYRYNCVPMSPKFLPKNLYFFGGVGGGSTLIWSTAECANGAKLTTDEAKDIYTRWLNGEVNIKVCTSNALAQGGARVWCDCIGINLDAADPSGNTVIPVVFYITNGEMADSAMCDGSFSL